MIILCILSEYYGNNAAFYRILNNYLYLCSRDFLLTLVQQIKSSKIINGMAKVSIKYVKIMADLGMSVPKC